MSDARNLIDYLCLGAHHMDWRVRLRGPLIRGESNPGSTQIRPGGVAHNVWRGLTAAGCQARLVSLPQPEDRLYMAVEQVDGSLAHGIACLDAYENLNADFLGRHSAQVAESKVLVVDGNCAQDLFEALPRHTCLALVAVSPGKMARLATGLSKAHWLFCNRAELAELHRLKADLPKDLMPEDLTIVETLGAEGLHLYSGGQVHRFDAPDLPFGVPDETGLGDILAASILAQIHKRDPVGAVATGLRNFPHLLTQVQPDLTAQP
ncbi:MAG: PfkB family carbohydrate kinase [Pseudomonadota bacterium]